MGNFIFYAVRSVYSIKWNPLDGQVDDARSKKMFLRIKRKRNTSLSLLIYHTQPLHFLLYDPCRSCHYGALSWWLLRLLLKCRGFSRDSSHSITLLKFATYFVRCTSTRDLFPKLRITLKLIDDNKKPLFCLFYFVHVNFAFRSDQWCAIKLSKARSIYLTKTILSSLCNYHFIQSCNYIRVGDFIIKT